MHVHIRLVFWLLVCYVPGSQTPVRQSPKSPQAGGIIQTSVHVLIEYHVLYCVLTQNCIFQPDGCKQAFTLPYLT